MSIVTQKLKGSYVSPATLKLLKELGEECQDVLKLLDQLEAPGLKAPQAEALLGELSAAVLHLHEHTKGLDALIDEGVNRRGSDA